MLPLLLPLGLRLEIAIMSDGDKVSEVPRKNGQLENRLSPPHPTFYTPNPRSPIPIPISHILAHRRLSAVCQCDGGQRAYLHLAATKLCFICICGSSCYSHAQGVHLAYMFIYLRRCCGHFDRWAPSANEQQLIKPWTLLTATIFQYICAGIRENRDIPGGLVANPMASDLSVSS